jgi:dihydrofolate reductase
MSKVIFENSISLDGFVAGPNDNPENGMGDGGMRLFAWYDKGDTDLPLLGTDMVFKVSRASFDFFQEEWSSLGVMVVGRRTFDIAHGWGGNPPGGGHTFVLTHSVPQEWVKEGSPFTFITDGIESAIRQAKQMAGDKGVSIASANIAQQCLKAGLLDEMILNVSPVMLNSGVRLFDNLGTTRIELEIAKVVQGTGVTHLKYRVVR